MASFSFQAMGFYRSIQEIPSAEKPAAVSPSHDKTQQQPGTTALSLFGSSGKGEEQGQEATLPESNLNLQVSAIFFTDPIEQSTVILEDGDKTVTLKRGEAVRQGIVIKTIESHRVTLERNGKLEQITFRGFSDGRDTALPASTQKTPPPPRLANTGQASPDKVAPQPVRKPTEQRTSTAYQKFMQRKTAQQHN